MVENTLLFNLTWSFPSRTCSIFVYNMICIFLPQYSKLNFVLCFWHFFFSHQDWQICVYPRFLLFVSLSCWQLPMCHLSQPSAASLFYSGKSSHLILTSYASAVQQSVMLTTRKQEWTRSARSHSNSSSMGTRHCWTQLQVKTWVYRSCPCLFIFNCTHWRK